MCGDTLRSMMKLGLAGLMLCCAFGADLKTAPSLPHKLVKDWAKLPPGWNFGECAGVDAAKDGTIWVFNRGSHPVIQFDKSGTMLQAWSEVPIVLLTALDRSRGQCMARGPGRAFCYEIHSAGTASDGLRQSLAAAG